MLDQIFNILDKVATASVTVAISIFLIKEYLERLRREKSKKSKDRSFAHVLGREIKDNLESIDHFYRIIDFIEEHKECKNIQLKLFRLIHGYESCQLIADNDLLEAQLPKFQTLWYEKLLVELAERDGKLAECVSNAYSNIYFLSEKRNLIASLMAGELSEFMKLCAVTTVSLLAPERERIESELRLAYKTLTGKENVLT